MNYDLSRFSGDTSPDELNSRVYNPDDKMRDTLINPFGIDFDKLGLGDLYRKSLNIVRELAYMDESYVKDGYTEVEYNTSRHSVSVANNTVRTAILSLGGSLEKMGAANRYGVAELYIAGLIHDVGKLYTPPEILNKKDEFTADDKAVMDRHAYDSGEILSRLGFPDRITDVAKNHHLLDYVFVQGENDKNKSKKVFLDHYFSTADKNLNIPLDKVSFSLQCLVLGDIYDAIRSKRPYKEGMGLGYCFSQAAHGPTSEEVTRNFAVDETEKILNEKCLDFQISGDVLDDPEQRRAFENYSTSYHMEALLNYVKKKGLEMLDDPYVESMTSADRVNDLNDGWMPVFNVALTRNEEHNPTFIISWHDNLVACLDDNGWRKNRHGQYVDEHWDPVDEDSPKKIRELSLYEFPLEFGHNLDMEDELQKTYLPGSGDDIPDPAPSRNYDMLEITDVSDGKENQDELEEGFYI